MRLNNVNSTQSVTNIKEFDSWILKIRDEDIHFNKNGKDIEIPQDLS